MCSEKMKGYVCEANPRALHHLDLPQLIFAVPHSKAVECACIRGCQEEIPFLMIDEKIFLARSNG